MDRVIKFYRCPICAAVLDILIDPGDGLVFGDSASKHEKWHKEMSKDAADNG